MLKKKKKKRNSVILPTLSYTSETWTWNAAQQLRIRAMEMSYMRGACGVSRWDSKSNEDTYGKFGMSKSAVGMDCGVVEWVKQSTLRWYGHVMRMNECDFTKKIYESTTEGRGVRRRPLVKWLNKVEEYWSGREWVGEVWNGLRECLNRETWRQLCLLGEVPLRGQGIKEIDR